MKLYEIPSEALDIESALADCAGELTPELEHRIGAFLHDGKEKIECAAIVVKSIENDAELCKQEADRLTARATALQKSAARLKAMIIFAVDEGFGGKVKTARFTIWAQTSAHLTIFDLAPGASVSSLPAEFLRVPDPEINRKALRQAFDDGAELPDSVIVSEISGTRFLRIK